jgi:hypothetical protein
MGYLDVVTSTARRYAARNDKKWVMLIFWSVPHSKKSTSPIFNSWARRRRAKQKSDATLDIKRCIATSGISFVGSC